MVRFSILIFLVIIEACSDNTLPANQESSENQDLRYEVDSTVYFCSNQIDTIFSKNREYSFTPEGDIQYDQQLINRFFDPFVDFKLDTSRKVLTYYEGGPDYGYIVKNDSIFFELGARFKCEKYDNYRCIWKPFTSDSFYDITSDLRVHENIDFLGPREIEESCIYYQYLLDNDTLRIPSLSDDHMILNGELRNCHISVVSFFQEGIKYLIVRNNCYTSRLSSSHSDYSYYKLNEEKKIYQLIMGQPDEISENHLFYNYYGVNPIINSNGIEFYGTHWSSYELCVEDDCVYFKPGKNYLLGEIDSTYYIGTNQGIFKLQGEYIIGHPTGELFRLNNIGDTSFQVIDTVFNFQDSSYTFIDSMLTTDIYELFKVSVPGKGYSLLLQQN